MSVIHLREPRVEGRYIDLIQVTKCGSLFSRVLPIFNMMPGIVDNLCLAGSYLSYLALGLTTILARDIDIYFTNILDEHNYDLPKSHDGTKFLYLVMPDII